MSEQYDADLRKKLSSRMRLLTAWLQEHITFGPAGRR